MSPRHEIVRFLLRFAVIAAMLASCGGPSTTIEQSWKAPDARIGKLRNAVTLYLTADGTMRRNVEDAMVTKLARAGIRATPSYTILSDDELEQREVAKAKLMASGYDGVIAIRLVSKEESIEYVPGTFDGYWGPAWSGAYSPGYMYTETVVRVEVSAYSLTNAELAWSALSKTVDPEGRGAVIDEVTTVAAKELQKQGIVARR